MPDSQWKTLIDVLKSERNIEFDDPMTDQEIADTENEFGFKFPPDLRDFLQTGLPISKKFPDWRNESRESLLQRLMIPEKGMLFDVEHNGFWLESFGERPQDLKAAFTIVRKHLAKAPKLIPVYAHRMIPDRPYKSGNPVFSVHQTDIIYYGINLRDYFIHEFYSESGLVLPVPDDIRQIEFWDIPRFHEIR